MISRIERFALKKFANRTLWKYIETILSLMIIGGGTFAKQKIELYKFIFLL